MSALALKYAVIALAILLVVGGMWWVAKRPNRSKRVSGRLRMPIFVPLVGAVLLSVGVLLALVSFTSRYTADLLPMRIASVVVALAGAFFLVAYRNWYVEADAVEVRFRTVFGRERAIRYVDIVDSRMRQINGQPRLQVRSSSGVKLSLNPRIYPVEALLAAAGVGQNAGR
ncbi:hypothetical protein [Microbacterium sp. A84]|uniref:hypothetical protein n=1 Tax=Microbacterium sp. A84 TaxID=3450715 RepID=UPI003F431A43